MARDELYTALPTESVLSRKARTDLAHYRARADQTRQHAASLRRESRTSTNPDRLLTQAATVDGLAAQWQALADELEAFATDQSPNHGEGLL